MGCSLPHHVSIAARARYVVFNEVIHTVLPSLSFDNVHEPKYKEIKETLPKHKSKYAAGKKIQLQFDTKAELMKGKSDLDSHGITSALMDGWAHRSISRDVTWGFGVMSVGRRQGRSSARRAKRSCALTPDGKSPSPRSARDPS